MKPPICSALWQDITINLRNGTIQYCCKSEPSVLELDHINSDNYIQDVRKRTLEGEFTDHCRSCWNDYKATGKAMRDIKNLWSSMDDFSTELKIVEIVLDNFCDLSCIYCNSSSSSRIAKELGKPKAIYSSKIEDYYHVIDWLGKQEGNFVISFKGGELTYSPYFYTFMDIALDRLKDKSVRYSIMTNGNSRGSRQERFYDLIKRIGEVGHRLIINVSNEAFGSQAELIRYGLDWKTFEDNINHFAAAKEIELFIAVPTLSAVSIKGFDEYIEWLINTLRPHNRRVKIFGNWVLEELDPRHANPDLVEHLYRAEEIILENADMILDIDHCLTWLKLMQDTVGTDPRDVSSTLKDLAKQKQDLEILDLYEYTL